MRARGATSIVLAGASLGGAAVLGAAAFATPPVDGVISLASPETFGTVRPLPAVAAFRVPALFLATEQDGDFPEFARELYDTCASPEKQLRIFPGFEHGVPQLRNPEARALVDAFIARHSQ